MAPSRSLQILLIILGIVMYTFGAVGLTDQYCKFTFPNGHTYDLKAAYQSSGDYGPIGDNSGMGNNYFLAPCHNSLTCSTVAIPGTLCQVDGIQQKHSCGLVATGSWEELTDGVRITYTGGHEGRSSVITYQCNPAATGRMVSAVESSRLTYSVTFETKYVCKGGGGGGGFDKGWIFVILLLCAAVIYFVGGAILLKYKYNAEGTQMVPNLEFWQSVPGLIRDGAVFAYQKITCQPANGYQPV